MSFGRRKVNNLTLIAMAVLVLGSVVTVVAQSQFPQIERRLWKELDPWGRNTGPAGEVIWAEPKDLNNIPSTLHSDGDDTDEFGTPVYQSIPVPGWPYESPYGSASVPSMDAAEAQFAFLNPGECTFSHVNDYDIQTGIYWPQARLCKGPGDRRLPPAPGRLLNPVGIAIDGADVYVADLFNHRIQKFDFYGNVKPMEFPIGNGIPGAARYDYDVQYPGFNYRPYPALPAAGFSGYQLSAPYGIALDGSQWDGAGAGPARRLLIADSGNDRIAIFNTNGSPAFTDLGGEPVHASIPTPLDNDGEPLNAEIAFKPDQLAISPGATVRAPGTAILDGDVDFGKRIVVTDRQKCWLSIMDVGFNVIKTYPESNPVGADAQHDACLEPALTAGPGQFSTITAVKIDAAGNIYVADHAQNVVQVFDQDGNHVAEIGKPGGSNPADPDGELMGPVGLMIGAAGQRLAVIDEGHARAVVYGITNGPADTTFEFQLDTTVAWDDFPMSLEMQVGPASKGLDPKGRILVTDPLRRRVLRFELPDLVVANLMANDGALTTPDGVGSFDVVVPKQKTGDVMDVGITITSEPNVAISNLVASDPSDPLNIAPGAVVHYTFDYTLPEGVTRVTFTVKAEGDAGLAKAPEVSDTARLRCANCLAEHKVYPGLPVPTPLQEAQLIAGTPTGDWYNQFVWVRITPTGSIPATQIRWQFAGDATAVYGGEIHEDPVLFGPGYPNGYVDVLVLAEGLSTLTYWPISATFGEGDPTVVELNIDVREPQVEFVEWPAPVATDSGNLWYRTNGSTTEVVGKFTVSDDYSGSPQDVAENGAPDGQVSFSAEGRNLVAPLNVVDYATNALTANSSQVTFGRFINIDNSAPQFAVGTPTVMSVARSGTDGGGIYAIVPAGTLSTTATDATLGDGSPGSGLVTGLSTLSNAGGEKFYDGQTFTFEAVDLVGNTSTHVVTVRVVSVVRIIASPQQIVYGQPAPTTFPYTMTGLPADVTITQAPTCGFSAAAPVAGGFYPTAITCSGAQATGNVVFDYTPGPYAITPAQPTASVTGGTFTYNAVAHGATGCTITGVNNEILPATLTYSPGPNAPINVATGPVTATCSSVANANYYAASATATVQIIKATPVITIAGGPWVYDGATHPATCSISGVFGVTATPAITYVGGLAPRNASSVDATCAWAGDANHNAVTSVTRALLVTPRPITVQATSVTKLLGALDPALTYTVSAGPLVAGDSFTGALTRAAGEAVGVAYAITQGTLAVGPIAANYTLTFIPGTLTILNANTPPVATADAASSVGAAPVTIAVLGNDSDLDGGTLSVTGVTQPTGGASVGVVTTSGNQVVFTPAPGFSGTTTFTYTISDGQGGTATATVTVTITAASCTTNGYLTYSQGGWGNNGAPGQFLAAKFAQVYPAGYVMIGGTKTLKFTSASAINAFLPAGGSPAVLTASAVNPTSSSAGNFAAQLLAMRLAVDFSAAGVTKTGLGNLVMVSGPFAGSTVDQILAVANAVIGGQTSALPSGMSISTLSGILESLNMNFHEGTVNNGLLGCPGQCIAGTIALSADSSATSGTAGNIRTFTGAGVSVKASAFSRAKSNGAWSTAFLGAFGSAGLGVTDGSEGSGADDKHKLDNLGDRLNYILFEFSTPVTVTRAYLDYIGADSDATIWIGTKTDPFTNHLTLSDALLTSLGAAQSSTATSTADRWATFNGSRVTANVLVIAADVADTTPDDAFKIAKLELTCALANRPPDAANDSLTTSKNTAKTISVVANDSDQDDDTLTVTAITQPSMGSVVNNGNGTLKYTPPANWTGTTTFTYTVSDGQGGTDTATVSVTVGSHTDNDGCVDDHDHDGDHDGDDDRERDCDRDHRHNSDCDSDRDHDRDCDHNHSRNSRCNDNDGWYRGRNNDDDRDHNHNSNGVCSNSSHYGSWYR